jgi:hypothetical protein
MASEKVEEFVSDQIGKAGFAAMWQVRNYCKENAKLSYHLIE